MNASEERVIFFHAIGRALEQWARVEAELEEVAEACVSPEDSGAIIAGLNAVENFRSKLAMCDAMVIHCFSSSPHLALWSNVKTKTGQVSQKRNKIAHNRHKHIANGQPGRRYALVPTRSTLKADPPLFVRDIEAARLEFSALCASLRYARSLLLGLSAQPPAFHEQSDRPPSLREIRDQIHAELGGLQKPWRRL